MGGCCDKKQREEPASEPETEDLKLKISLKSFKTVENRVDENEDDIYGLSKKIKKQGTSFEDGQKRLNDTINDLEHDLNNKINDVDKNLDHVTRVNHSRVDDLNDTINGINHTHDGLNQTINNINATANGIVNSVGRLQDTVADLRRKQDEIISWKRHFDDQKTNDH